MPLDAPRRQVLCIRWGHKYGPDYVNRLFAMVRRNLDGFDFVCLTDDPTGLDPRIHALPLPDLGCDYPDVRRGIWGKARLWRSDIGVTGPVLFIDLDMVVTGRLEPFFDHGEPDDVILARNPSTPFERLGQTSIYRFPVGKLQPLHDAFLADPTGIARRYRYEQRFVTRNAPGGVTFWPRRWVSHFRHDCVWFFPLNYVLPPRLPRDARVVMFAGDLNPPDAIAGRYSKRLPAGEGPRAHLRTALRHPHYAGQRIRGVRQYLRPTRWVAEAWRGDG